jgi:hypothetical protein
MNTLFGILLIICTILYSIRMFTWIWVMSSKGRRETFYATGKLTPKTLWYSGVEHLFYMVTLIGSTILLL